MEKFIEIMRTYENLWKPFHKDYDNRTVMERSWLEVTKKQLGNMDTQNPTIVEVRATQEIWNGLVKDDFVRRLTGGQTEKWGGCQYNKLKFLKCGLSDQLFKTFGIEELLRRAEWYLKQTNRKIDREERYKESNGKNSNNIADQLRRQQEEAEEKEKYDTEVFPGKDNLEKAILVESVRSNPCLWQADNDDFKDDTRSEAAWKSIAERLSGSKDYYYVLKYQRMWQGLVRKFVANITDQSIPFAHFQQMKQFIVKQDQPLEKQITVSQEVLKAAEHFIKTLTIEKMNARPYELRPAVIEGYRSQMGQFKVNRDILNENEDNVYISAMKEVMKKKA